MDRLFERAFNKVHSQVNTVQSEFLEKEKQKQGDGGGGGDAEGAEGQPETAQVAIKRILDCWKNKEYFK